MDAVLAGLGLAAAEWAPGREGRSTDRPEPVVREVCRQLGGSFPAIAYSAETSEGESRVTFVIEGADDVDHLVLFMSDTPSEALPITSTISLGELDPIDGSLQSDSVFVGAQRGDEYMIITRPDLDTLATPGT